MRFTSETTSNCVSERHFTLDGIPGNRPRTERDQRFTAHIREQAAAGEPVGSRHARMAC
jgi:hypothetical protein